MHQKKPSTVEVALAAMLETGSILLPASGLGRIAHIGAEEQQDTQESLVSAVKTQQVVMVDLMSHGEAGALSPLRSRQQSKGPYPKQAVAG